jgi:hypothetical protein
MKERIVVLSVIVVSIIILIFTDFGKEGRVYDCGMAEWQPDIPIQVKEECRRLRNEYRKLEEQKENKIYI